MNMVIEYPDFSKLDFPIDIFHNRVEDAPLIVHPHIHQPLEILYLVKGQGDIRIEDHTHHLTAGDMIVLNTDIIHSVDCKAADITDFLVIRMNLESLYSPESIYGKRMIHALYHEVDFSQPIKKGSSLHSILSYRLEKIDRLTRKQTDTNRSKILAYLLEFMGLCLEHLPRIEKNNTHHKDRVALYQALSYVEENYTQDITIDHISEISGYSVSQFSRIMKKYTNMTFMNYLNNIRVNKVCIEMLHGEKVSNAAFANGFNSLSSFNRVFKKVQGISPSEWKKQLKD